MRKRTLWLAKSYDYNSAALYTKRPKAVGGKGKGIPCGCGDVNCWELRPEQDTVSRYEGPEVETFCGDGLEAVGIVLRPGELVKVTLETVR